MKTRKKRDYPKKDLVGVRFGMLVVESFESYRESSAISSTGFRRRFSYWNCICDCGNKCTVMTCALGKGNYSCGCYRKNLKWNTSKNKTDIGQSLNCLYKIYKTSAKSRGLEFALTKDEFESITSDNCYLCGVSPSKIHNAKLKPNCILQPYIYNGVDRYDNNIGYILSNCKPCCTDCNLMKNTHDIKYFMEKVRDIVAYADKNEK